MQARALAVPALAARLLRPASGDRRRETAGTLQQAIGNRRVQQLVQGGALDDIPKDQPRVPRTDVKPTAPTSLERVLSQPGAPLEPDVLQAMEAAFGARLSWVRIHTGAAAAAAAEDLQAHAFTVGHAVVFGRDQYAPRTSSGLQLLAHELTHTLQQGPVSDLCARAGELTISDPSDGHEHEAGRVAQQLVMGGAQVRVPSTSTLSTGHGQIRIQRQPATAPSPAPAAPAPASPELVQAAAVIAQAVRDENVGAAVPPLRNRSLADVASLRRMVKEQTSPAVELEDWLVQRLNRAANVRTASTLAGIAVSLLTPGVAPLALLAPSRPTATDGTAEEGLRLLWRALPLLDRLEVYDEGYREIEQAQLDVIRAASAEERADALKEPARLAPIYANMSPKEEYDARTLMEPTPQGRYTAAVRLLDRAPGVFSSAEDAVFDAILALAPFQRRTFFNDQIVKLYRLLPLWQFRIVQTLAQGSEAQALIARLRLATEGRIDDQAAVTAVIDRAVALLRERRELRLAVASASLPAAQRATIEARLRELDDLDTLLQFRRSAGGALAENTFMSLVAGARDNPETFGADAQRLAEFATDRRRYAFEVGKQRILLAGANVEAIRAAIYSVHAPPPAQGPAAGPGNAATAAQLQADQELRAEILRDPEVGAVVGRLSGLDARLVRDAAAGDLYNEAVYRLNEARRAARWGEVFQITLTIARNDAWRTRFQASAGEIWGTYSWIGGAEREIMETILRDRRLPLAAILRYTGNVDTLRAAFANIGEEERGRLRLGASLARERPMGPLTEEDDRALRAYQEFEAATRASQTTLGIFDRAGYEAVLSAALGTEPTAAEMATGEGRYRAAALMYERQEARLALGRGASAYFTEADEAMVAAAREFAALWLRVRDQRTLSIVEFAALSALHQRFLTRAEEFTEASNAIGEMASTIAATVAGIVVVVATGGAATPGVIALAAAAGAGAGVVTREMFGDEYYNALSETGARDALLRGIDGALAVVSGGLAARGAQLLGLGGHALAGSAARIAGSVAEEAMQPFARRVAAGAVEAALDGLFSGTVSEAFGTLTDERTWRRGVMEGLVRVGQAALVGGLIGLGTGGVVGASLPVLGRGARLLREAVVGQSIENTLRRAGATDTLATVRAAARRGDTAEVNRLAAQLDPLLSSEEAAALRNQLYQDLRDVLGHPAGTFQPERGSTQERLLRESGGRDDGLTAAHIEAETDVVRRSEPRPSTDRGYIDEVDLGNGHTWRRQADGTWCRFTKKILCGTVIPGAPTISPTARAREAVVRADLASTTGLAARQAESIERFPEILRRLREGRVPGQRTINVNVLTDQEQDLLRELIAHRELQSVVGRRELEELTIGELDQIFRPPTRRVPDPRGADLPPIERPTGELSPAQRVLQTSETAVRRLQEELNNLTRSLYERIRAGSPGKAVSEDVLRRAAGLDEVSRARPFFGTLSVDHTVPLRDIVNMPGFSRLAELDYQAAREIADWLPNLRAIDSQVNSYRQAKSWAESFQLRDTYSSEQLSRIIAKETELRGQIQKRINDALIARGQLVP